MPERREEIAEIAENGTVQPRGSVAQLRLQSRSGEYRVLPAPEEVVLLKRTQADGAERACLVFGEIRSAGALCDLLGFVSHTGWKGEFIVKDGTSTRSLFFEQGHVIGAKSTVVTERLGEVLYRHGVLTREQVTRCAEASAEGALRFGEVAVRLGFVAREPLFRSMARQTEEIVYGALLVASGTYFFLEGYDEAQLASRQELPVTALLREGIRRMHETRYFRARIPSVDHVPARVSERAAPAADPLGVLASIDGVLSVADLCRRLGHGEFEVTRVLFQLVQAGHVVIKEPRLSVAATVRIYNNAIALLLRELDAMDEGDAVREQLATFTTEPSFAALLAGAGPSDDGTLDASVVTENVGRADPRTAEALPQKLYELGSYALFLARPHLDRMAPPRDGTRPRLSARVSAILDPIAGEKSPVGGQGGRP